MSISVSSNAMNVFGLSQSVTANNIANINTDGFKSSHLDMKTGPDGIGVRVAAINSPTSAESMTQGSNTDLTREMTTMIQDKHAFNANAKAINTASETTGYLMDLIV